MTHDRPNMSANRRDLNLGVLAAGVEFMGYIVLLFCKVSNRCCINISPNLPDVIHEGRGPPCAPDGLDLV